MGSIGEAPVAPDMLQSIVFAQARVQISSQLGDGALIARADAELRSAVHAALDSGVSWGIIGRCLGLARGSAYQKYRRRDTQPANAGR